MASEIMEFELQCLGEANLVKTVIKTQKIFQTVLEKLQPVFSVLVLHSSDLVKTDSVELL